MEVEKVREVVKKLLMRNFTIFRIPGEILKGQINEFTLVKLFLNYYARSLIAPETQLILKAILKSKRIPPYFINTFVTHLGVVSMLVDPILDKIRKDIEKGIYLLFRRGSKKGHILDLIIYDFLRVSKGKRPVFAEWVVEFFSRVSKRLILTNFKLTYFDVVNIFEFWLLKVMRYPKTWHYNYPVFLWTFGTETYDLNSMQEFFSIKPKGGKAKIFDSRQITLDILENSEVILNCDSMEEKAAELSGLFEYFSSRIYFKILSDIFYRRLLLSYFDEVEVTYETELTRWNLNEDIDFDATLASYGILQFPFLYSQREVEGDLKRKRIGRVKWFLIIDSSGSMTGEKFYYACALARGFALFAKKNKIPVYLIYFSHKAYEGDIENLINFKCRFIGASTYINSVIEVLKKKDLKDSQFFIFSDCMWHDISIAPLVDFLKGYDIFVINVSDDVTESFIREKGGSGLYYFTLRELLKVRKVSRYLFKRIL